MPFFVGGLTLGIAPSFCHFAPLAAVAIAHPQSSSASRLTASQAGFFILSQSFGRPER
jgi:hypothetical protein